MGVGRWDAATGGKSGVRDAAVGRRPALALLCAAQFVQVLNFQIVAVALPLVGRGLGLSAEGLQWAVSANALAFGGGLLPAGRAADLVGHRRLFVAGLGLFAGASLACGLAPSVGVLLGARAAQGLGTAMFTPAALALLADTFPAGPERNRALGIWGASGPLGGIVSVLLGGALADALGWRWVFFLSAPVAAGAAVLAPRVLAADRDRGQVGRPDLLGAGLATAGVVVLVHALGAAARPGGQTGPAAALLGVGVALLAAFVAVERKTTAPLVPPALIRRGEAAGANLVAFLHGAATNTPIFFFALFVQQVRGGSPLATGLAFLPCNLGVIGGAALGTRLAERTGYGRTMAAGMGTVAIGLPMLARMSVEGAYAGVMLPGFALWGLGLGMAQVGIVGAATAGARGEERGVAAGLVTTAAQVGTAVGLALLVASATARTEAIGGAGAEATVEGFRWAFLGGAVLALVGMGVAIVVGRRGIVEGSEGRDRTDVGAGAGSFPRSGIDG